MASHESVNVRLYRGARWAGIAHYTAGLTARQLRGHRDHALRSGITRVHGNVVIDRQYR